jgi:hypothetical protein
MGSSPKASIFPSADTIINGIHIKLIDVINPTTINVSKVILQAN